ncbi:MAG: CPBP family intramembrane metalloprotease [Gemmatimonadota bacterium]|nr:CPBP family intramembrane metalloprotease [Gemmatimonadota bacterium]
MTFRGVWFAPGGAIRAPWRLLLFAVCALVVIAILGSGVMLLSPASISRPEVGAWTSLIGVVVAHVVMVRVVDRRPWSMVALDRAAARPSLLGSGLLLGALAIAIPSGALFAIHWLSVVTEPPGMGWMHFAGTMGIILLPAALFEELLVRGYPFAVLRDALGWKWALVSTSVVFGLLHLQNPNVSAEPIILVVLAGFFLGSVLLVTRSLYCAWMAHFAWNYVMSAMMHTAVSGLAFIPPDYQTMDTGPDWATGGAWGPEGGAFAAVGMLLFTVPLFLRYMRRATTTGTAE